MRAIHQFHAYASPGDAITNQMLFIQRSLAQARVGGEIFSMNFPSSIADRVRHFKSSALWNGDLLLIHHSQGHPYLSELLKVEIPKALVYHNITPKEFYEHNPYLKRLSVIGRRQLKTLKRHVIASFAVSQFNAAELEGFGYPHPKILPLFDLSEDAMPLTAPKTKERGSEILRLLFVGRIAPHKNQARLLEIFYHLKQIVPRHLELVLVGGGDPVYLDYLKLLRKQLELTLSVEIVGHIDDKKLHELYATSHAFVCPSLHEGFCIPLIEAMRYDLPVFAYPAAAIGETLGKSGIHLNNIDKPVEAAQAIATVLSSETALKKVITSQRKRLKDLRDIQNPKTVQDTLSTVIDAIRHDPKHLSSAAPLVW